MSLGSAKSSSGSTPSESSGSSMAEESSIYSSMAESAGSSAADESSSGSTAYGESAGSSAVSSESDSGSVGSGESGGSSSGGYCSFDVYDINVPASNVGVFSVYNSGTVPLTLQLLTIYVEFWDYEPYFPLVLAPGEAVVVTITLPSDRTMWGAYAVLDTSCGASTWNFPS